MTKHIEFINGIFGKDFSGSEAKPLYCGFRDDPQTCKSWHAEVASGDSLPDCINKRSNCYFTPSVFVPSPEGKYRKKDVHFFAASAFVIDDIGTKVKSKRVKLPLSWKIETSPGNFQGGYILDVPCTDLQLMKALTEALAQKKLTDPGAKGGARWARLPFGVNTKNDYVEAYGVSPKVKLVEWYPERRYSIDDIIAAYSLTIDCERKDCPTTNNSDSVLSALVEAGLWKSLLERGKHDITCPWVTGHSSEIDHGTVYYEPSEANGFLGGFKCQHGHCAN